MADEVMVVYICSGLSEELACTAASRDYARTRLPGEPKMLAKHGATLSGPELINHGTRHAGAAMVHLAVLGVRGDNKVPVSGCVYSF